VTYEYKCDGCGAVFTREQRITDPAIRVCPHCGRRKARRLIAGAGAFILRGTGWGDTGY